MPAPVVVEVYAPQPSNQELSVLLAACSRASTPHECVGADVKSSEPPLGVAIVRRDGDRARIELGLRSVVKAEWSTRDLVFQPGDDELERYRAIGFAIGTLVARDSAPPPPPEAPPVASPPATPSREPPSKAPPRPTTSISGTRRAAWVDVSGSVGLGLIPGPPRAGGSLRAALELIPHGTFGVLEGGYAERSGESSLRVRWLSAALGVGHPLVPRQHALGVDVRLLFGVERMSFTAVDGGDSDEAARWKPGVTAAIDGHWDFAPPVALVVSAATFIAPRRTEVDVAGTRVGETPALGLNGFVGVRLKLR